MFFRCSAFLQIGGFDPRFFLYFEETDLCRRFTSSGWGIWLISQAQAHHVGGASANNLPEDLEMYLLQTDIITKG